jgi:hypothetical protein
MNQRFRRIVIVFFLLLLVSLASLQVVQADPGGVVTPDNLMEQGWTCLYRFDKYAYCMNPNFEGLGPVTIMNKTFLVSDSSFSDPEYLGTSLFIRADKYADQPCPTNSSPFWELVLNNMYYNCRHFEQNYP